MIKAGAQKMYAKVLAPNDNSKNQFYLSGSFDVLNILPSKNREFQSHTTKRGKILKAAVDLDWISLSGDQTNAPDAQFIYYPQYPEVRLSSLLKKSPLAPRELIVSREAGRVLLIGVRTDQKLLAYMVSSSSRISKEIQTYKLADTSGVLLDIPLHQREQSSTDKLIEALKIVHQKGWIASKSLGQDGSVKPCRARNCIGYTLEAELGIPKNGDPSPDFIDWELKAGQVKDFNAGFGSKPVTLLTPEPTGGHYREAGVESFVSHFGYPDKRGIKHRLNFGGVHRVGVRHATTGLTLSIQGVDAELKKISSDGELQLVSDAGEIAASWGFDSLLSHWSKKHAKAAFVPGERRELPSREYRYGNTIMLGQGTDFQYFLRALHSGCVYYDPGIKVENLNSKPKAKRRSQFRIKATDLNQLYKTWESVVL